MSSHTRQIKSFDYSKSSDAQGYVRVLFNCTDGTKLKKNMQCKSKATAKKRAIAFAMRYNRRAVR